MAAMGGLCTVDGEPLRNIGAWGSIALLIFVAASKTLLTKFLFTEAVDEPIAYSLLSAVETALLVSCHGFGKLQPRTSIRLYPVAIAIAIDLGMSNVAISRLPLALQQAIASSVPAATILLETIVRRRCKPLLIYVVISALCAGALLGHLGSLSNLDTPTDSRSFFHGELAMVLAVFSAAYKYVFAKDLLHTYQEVLGPLRLLLWIECMVCTILLPWSIAITELPQLVRTRRSLAEATALCGAAALGGFRFYVELIVLKYWSATTLSAANLSAHALIIILSIPLFGTPFTPLLLFGTSVTLAASFAYGWIKIMKFDVSKSTRGENGSGQGARAMAYTSLR
mmetsp:Transcript_5707/g.15179  ORF Transcript_5707/g.15179 Transcript_5707/m.15179 type:complete len:340 (+) Transcript_5707:44-1063(+)